MQPDGKGCKDAPRKEYYMRIKNKVALITGGTSGIGSAALALFVAEGARVAFTGRRAELGKELEQRYQARYIYADHRRSADCERSVAETLAEFGRIDILFNNAGIVVNGTAETTSEEDWQDTLDLNITAVWRMSRLVIPIMRTQGGGVIINNASDWGLVGAANALAYAASKGAVVQMTRCMALDHAKENIRVNAVCPGDTFVERWIKEGYFRESGAVSEAEARLSDTIPMGRVADASEIAKAVLFLASSDSSFMTGATLVVDGGNTAQ
jgi:meso-butanediol dehydrogenase / (S,S)-butanediol dehydrogenase / diacetyl reductase